MVNQIYNTAVGTLNSLTIKVKILLRSPLCLTLKDHDWKLDIAAMHVHLRTRTEAAVCMRKTLIIICQTKIVQLLKIRTISTRLKSPHNFLLLWYFAKQCSNI